MLTSQLPHRLIAPLCLALLLSTSAVNAHGPAPSPLKALVLSADGVPDMIQTSIGMAFLNASGDDTYRYGCPSQWGDADLVTPLAAALGPQTLLIVGYDDFYVSTASACPLEVLTGDGIPPSNRVVALHGTRTHIWGLANLPVAGTETTNSQLWRWSPRGGFESVHVFEAIKLSSLDSDGDKLILIGAKPTPSRFEIDTTAPLKTPQEKTLLLPGVENLEAVSLRLIQPDGKIWLVATQNATQHLFRSDETGESWRLLAASTQPIHGPAPLCDGVFAFVDGTPFDDPKHPTRCDISTLGLRKPTCLRHVQGATYLCELGRLVHLVDDLSGTVGQVDWFTLEQLQGPDLSCAVNQSAAAACYQDWLHEGAEAGLFTPDSLVPTEMTPPTQDEAPKSETPEGCQLTRNTLAQTSSPQTQKNIILLVLIIFFNIYQRNRRHQKTLESY